MSVHRTSLSAWIAVVTALTVTAALLLPDRYKDVALPLGGFAATAVVVLVRRDPPRAGRWRSLLIAGLCFGTLALLGRLLL